ncbi:hypothetical protein TYRP_007590 [Tyrophagus putrescentiae]|nr:hypothetical protein TYRP_007590 [Tyrophagus putrescentiae]
MEVLAGGASGIAVKAKCDGRLLRQLNGTLVLLANVETHGFLLGAGDFLLHIHHKERKSDRAQIKTFDGLFLWSCQVTRFPGSPLYRTRSRDY